MAQAATHPKLPRKSGWSPERRAKQSASIHSWSPWSKSTGPRTAAGKARAAKNAAKPERKDKLGKLMKYALRQQSHYLADLNDYIRLKKFFSKNELLKPALKNHRRRLRKQALRASAALVVAITYAKLCKNLAFSDPFPLKVNAVFATAVSPALRRVEPVATSNDNEHEQT